MIRVDGDRAPAHGVGEPRQLHDRPARRADDGRLDRVRGAPDLVALARHDGHRGGGRPGFLICSHGDSLRIMGPAGAPGPGTPPTRRWYRRRRWRGAGEPDAAWGWPSRCCSSRGSRPPRRRSRSASRTRCGWSPTAACRPGCARTWPVGARWSGWCCASTARWRTPRSSRSRMSWASISGPGPRRDRSWRCTRAAPAASSTSAAPSTSSTPPAAASAACPPWPPAARASPSRRSGPAATRSGALPSRAASGPGATSASTPGCAGPPAGVAPSGQHRRRRQRRGLRGRDPATGSSTTRSASIACAAGPTV